MLLVGDIGGTNTRLGLFEAVSPRPAPVDARTYATADFSTLEAMLAAFLADAGKGPATIEGAAFGVAGPVVHGRAALTNAAWDIDARAVARALGLPSVRLLNDLLAMAHAVPVLSAAELRTLQDGVANPDGNVSLIAPGTGLGEALLVNNGGTLVPSPSEAGHADFAARTTREVGLLAFLIGQFGRVDYERVISGPGLVNIHRFVHRSLCAAADPDAPDAAAEISRAALDRRCAACVETLDLFVAVLGAEAGNSALRGMTTGGVFLGGGIPPKIIPALEGGTFLDAFRAKAPMEDLVGAIPVHVIIHPEPGLLGAAVAAAGARR
ncbi:MAG: glucokinase [Vicinamibacterales bacterium]